MLINFLLKRVMLSMLVSTAVLMTLETGVREACLTHWLNYLQIYQMHIPEPPNSRISILEISTFYKWMVIFFFLFKIVLKKKNPRFLMTYVLPAESSDDQKSDNTPKWVALAIVQSYNSRRKIPRSSISIPDLERCLEKASFSAAQNSGKVNRN